MLAYAASSTSSKDVSALLAQDADDESLARYKAQLLGAAATGDLGDSSDPRRVVPVAACPSLLALVLPVAMCCCAPVLVHLVPAARFPSRLARALLVTRVAICPSRLPTLCASPRVPVPALLRAVL